MDWFCFLAFCTHRQNKKRLSFSTVWGKKNQKKKKSKPRSDAFLSLWHNFKLSTKTLQHSTLEWWLEKLVGHPVHL